MCLDALDRNESCGGHFREEYQTPDGEALRDDAAFLLRRRLGISTAPDKPPRAAQRAARVRIRASQPTELQVNETHPPHLAAEERQRQRARMVRYEVPGRQSGDVVPRDARRPQREPDRQGRRAGRLRPRLPRGHLRHVRLHDQRRRARPAARHHGLPAAHAPFQGWRRAISGALARAAPSRSSRTWWSTAAPSTASSPPAASSRAPTGSAPDGNAILVPKEAADLAMDAAACIGCGACVATCPNASAALFTGAKITHLGLLPQGQPERYAPRPGNGGAGQR